MLKTRFLNKLMATVGVQAWWTETAHGFTIPVRGAPDFVGLSNTGFRETPLYRWLAVQADHLQREAWIVDVGAFVGEFALACADLLGREVRYVGFEPSLNAAAYTEHLLALNGFKNAFVVPAALWKETAFLEQFRDAEFASGATLVEEVACSERFRSHGRVMAFAGDRMLQLAGVAPVGLLKIDVEGAEALVLDGLREIVRRDRPIIVFEALPWSHQLYPAVERIPDEDTRRRGREGVAALERMFRDNGYLINHIHRDGREVLVPSLEIAADNVREIALLNYVARPETPGDVGRGAT